MKKIIASISFILVISCAGSSERMRADDFFAKGDYIKALRSYELALSKSTTNSQRNEIQKQIDKTKVKIVSDALKRAELAFKKDDPPSLQSTDDAIFVLLDCPTEDRSERISDQIKKYQDIAGLLVSLILSKHMV